MRTNRFSWKALNLSISALSTHKYLKEYFDKVVNCKDEAPKS